MGYYSVVQRDDLSSHEKTWKKFACILLSGGSQSEKSKCSMSLSIGMIFWKRQNYGDEWLLGAGADKAEGKKNGATQGIWRAVNHCMSHGRQMSVQTCPDLWDGLHEQRGNCVPWAVVTYPCGFNNSNKCQRGVQQGIWEVSGLSTQSF